MTRPASILVLLGAASLMSCGEVPAPFDAGGSTEHALSVTRVGAGTVTSSPAGIDCGSTCTASFDAGTSVTLTATAADGATFAGWSGACAGTADCTVTLDGDVAVTATFEADSHTLMVDRVGTGSGTVSSSPGGIDCGADCEEDYDDGTVVTLTATPDGASTFEGWSGGDCPGTGTCQVTMTAATTITASFGCRAGSVTYEYTGALQTFVVPACVTSITIDAHGAEGGSSLGENGGMLFSGGRGARAQGTFAVSPSQSFDILVGGRGGDSNCGSGGGGGSFVVSGGTLMVAAGGGGGGFHCNAIGGATGVGGNITTSGGTGVCGTLLPRSPTVGGSDGNGARSAFGGGGGGFVTAGTSDYDTAGGGGAYPGAGGNVGGGYGGGGGYYYQGCCGGSGGGGGYSGGGGGESDGCAGGGGGSYNAGTSPLMQDSARAGNGAVTISY